MWRAKPDPEPTMSMMSSLMLHHSMRFGLKYAVDQIILGEGSCFSVDLGRDKAIVVWKDGGRILARSDNNSLSEVVDHDRGLSAWYWKQVTS